jgi:hypothetical protein
MDRIPTPWIVWFLAATLTAASPVPRLIGIDGMICWTTAEAGSVACNAGGPVEGCCMMPCGDDGSAPGSCAATPCARTGEQAAATPCADTGEQAAATPCADAGGSDTPPAGPPDCNLCIACQCGISVIACPAGLVPPAPEPVLAEAPPALPASLAFEPAAPPPEVLSKFS